MLVFNVTKCIEYMVASKNVGTPKSSILIRSSIYKASIWGSFIETSRKMKLVGSYGCFYTWGVLSNGCFIVTIVEHTIKMEGVTLFQETHTSYGLTMDSPRIFHGFSAAARKSCWLRHLSMFLRFGRYRCYGGDACELRITSCKRWSTSHW